MTGYSVCIEAAAYRDPYGRLYAIPAPAAHHEILQALRREGFDARSWESGFITSDRAFVNRYEAADIAVRAGQIATERLQPLFSEDLWNRSEGLPPDAAARWKAHLEHGPPYGWTNDEDGGEAPARCTQCGVPERKITDPLWIGCEVRCWRVGVPASYVEYKGKLVCDECGAPKPMPVDTECLSCGVLTPDFEMPERPPVADHYTAQCNEALEEIQKFTGYLTLSRREAIARKLAPIFNGVHNSSYMQGRAAVARELQERAEEPMTDIDTNNKHLVGVKGEEIVVLRPPNRLSRKDALVFAAWLVVLADEDGEFADVLETVRNT